jgi:hypothetical protein
MMRTLLYEAAQTMSHVIPGVSGVYKIPRRKARSPRRRDRQAHRRAFDRSEIARAVGSNIGAKVLEKKTTRWTRLSMPYWYGDERCILEIATGTSTIAQRWSYGYPSSAARPTAKAVTECFVSGGALFSPYIWRSLTNLFAKLTLISAGITPTLDPSLNPLKLRALYIDSSIDIPK